jgi:hypothetical protein
VIRIRIWTGPGIVPQKRENGDEIPFLKSLNVLCKGSKRHMYMTVFDQTVFTVVKRKIPDPHSAKDFNPDLDLVNPKQCTSKIKKNLATSKTISRIILHIFYGNLCALKVEKEVPTCHNIRKLLQCCLLLGLSTTLQKVPAD